MNDHRRDHDLFLERLLSGLGDSLEKMPDEQLLAEVREGGEDPQALAREIRGVMGSAVKRFRQRDLEKARNEYTRSLDAFRRRSPALPEDMASKRALLASVLASRADLSGLTAQWRDRDLDGVPDEDVDGLLEQLANLGLLET